MALNPAQSPLAWSIGGVGAIAITLIGVSYLSQGDPAIPGPELSATPSAQSLWQQGKDLGWQAAVAAQGAQTQADWQRVAGLWDEAIALLEQVPAEAPDHSQAKAKAEEYRRNRAVALTRQGQNSSGPAPASPMISLQRALAATDPAFTFTPVGDALVGLSEDGLARVELVGNRATLILPTDGQGDLTMAQVVYAHNFVAIAAPGAQDQPWLFEGLRAVQRNQPPTLPADAPITLSAGAETLAITVVAEP